MPICLEPVHRPVMSQVSATQTDEVLDVLVQKSSQPSLADLYRKAKSKGVLTARTSYQ